MDYSTVLKFWLEDTEPKQRFTKDLELDARIRDKFLSTYWRVVAGEHADWRDSAAGRLAEIIVLDQFARNMFRDDPQAFMYDPLALALAQEAIRAGAEAELEASERSFLYMPFMHSESALVHEHAVELFTKLGNELNLEYEYKHKAIIDRFGRYPHRNAVLGRESSAEEVAFVAEHGGF